MLDHVMTDINRKNNFKLMSLRQIKPIISLYPFYYRLSLILSYTQFVFLYVLN